MHRTHGTGWLVVGLVLGLLTTQAAGNRRASTEDDATKTALTGAVDALRAEVAAYIADPMNATLRTKSDYFTPTTAPDVASVVTALGQRQDRNTVIDSYIKWQLLSAVGGEFPEEHRRAVVQAYRRAPTAVPFAGIAKQEQAQLDQMVQRGSEIDIPIINEQWGNRNEEARRSNQIILAYRDGLFAKLPIDAEVIELGLRDAVSRASAGLDPRKFTSIVMQRTRLYAIAGAPPQHLQALSRLYVSLREAPGVQVYSSVQWKDNRVQWKTDTRRINPRIDTKNPANDSFFIIANELQQMAQNPSGGLKLKND